MDPTVSYYISACCLAAEAHWLAQVVVNLLEEDGVEAALKMALEVQFKAFQRAEPSKRLKCDHVQPSFRRFVR